jgi:hypothetical protein
MIRPTATALLGAWERGVSQSPVQRALTLLSLVSVDALPEQLALLSIGRRDMQLLNLREWVFGSQMTGHAACPACALELELNFSIPEIRSISHGDAPESCDLAFGDYEVCFRLPNSADLQALSRNSDAASSACRLLERCLIRASKCGEEVGFQQLPTEVQTAISERMGEIDPLGDVQLSLKCPQCGHHWKAPFDIVSFLWTEIHSWAHRLLGEVHALASAYGWRETDILALSPWRRQAYLEMIPR